MDSTLLLFSSQCSVSRPKGDYLILYTQSFPGFGNLNTTFLSVFSKRWWCVCNKEKKNQYIQLLDEIQHVHSWLAIFVNELNV